MEEFDNYLQFELQWHSNKDEWEKALRVLIHTLADMEQGGMMMEDESVRRWNAHCDAVPLRQDVGAGKSGPDAGDISAWRERRAGP